VAKGRISEVIPPEHYSKSDLKRNAFELAAFELAALPTFGRFDFALALG